MTQQSLYPLLLNATLHVKVWGGHKLAQVLGKTLPGDAPYGEAWEVHDTSLIANGPLAGQTIADILPDYGADLLGEGVDPANGLPLLVKLLDAEQWLSVQVHPDDAQAAELEGQPRGKTEAWIILAADPGAELVIGVQPGTTREQMAQAIRDDALEPLLVRRTVEPGDVLYIPAGTVHAIGPGVLLYEIQQSSDTTYRLYDWGRVGLDGQPRELHIEKGVQVSNLHALPEIAPAGAPSPEALVIDGQFFRTARHHLDSASVDCDTDGRFHTLTCVEGSARVVAGEHALTLEKGRSALIPAVQGAYMLEGTGTVLRSWQQL
ncbi:MAG: type I phosphomannose isomerase catalytic subunit [Chloroflexota bacterium]